jgi:glycosyltransferase involved in cell wall biosynthesis
VRMFAPAEAEPVTQESLKTHYGLRLLPPLELLPSMRGLKRLDFLVHAQRHARKFNADLIYTWLPQSAVLGLWMKYPVVLEMHADVSGRMGAWWLRQFWRAKGRKRMTVTTSALERALERSAGFGFDDDAVVSAPNGVELDRYENLPSPSQARRQLNLPEGSTVGFTGHIYPGRGAELLFELAKGMPHVNFLWVGGTPDLVAHWRSKLAEVGAANVTLTGFVEHSRIPLYQAAADVLLMPYSRSIEASSGQDIAEVINPMKMFEYMASGRAIVCADLPVIREVMNEGNAVFCEAGKWELVISNWRLAIESLLADESRRVVLGAQARRDVEMFSWVKREERVLEGIIK